MPSLASLVLASLAATGAYAHPHVKRDSDGLNIRAKAAGKLYFGSATDNPEFSNAAYMAQLSNTSDFGQITPGNAMKWDAIEPSRNTFTYTKGDAVISVAKANGQLARCHTLVWHSQLPSWVSNGGFDNATLIEIMTNHIENTMTHYKGQCYAWDVVNEALNEDGTFRSSVFLDTIGPAYIPIAFAAAAAADPSAKLYYNDYNIESAGAKSTAAQDIVKLVQSYGAKIDAVGFQSHFIVGSTPSTDAMVKNMEAYAALDVEIALTELDIRATLPVTDAALEKQATDYANVITACKNVAKCVGITIWDYTDLYSWVPSVFQGQGAALPWDENLNKKPAYDAMLSAWGTAPPATAIFSTKTSSATSAPAPITTSARASTTTSAPASTTTAAAGGAEHWAQCGGNGWTGATTCAGGYTCTFSNDWFSQCL